MTAFDRDHLQRWYRDAMRARVAELESLRQALADGREGAVRQARGVGHALQGSGGSFGFPEITQVGALLEGAPPEAMVRKVEGVIRVLRASAWPDDPSERRPFAWLEAVVPGALLQGSTSLAEAWSRAAEAAGVPPRELAARVARHYGVQEPEALRPTPGALRLVPSAWGAERGVLPLDEDGVVLRVATADPVDLLTEVEIRRMAGRGTSFVVVPPQELAGALSPAPPPSPARPAAATPEVVPAECPVLLVDDDPAARVIAKAVLERKGFPVVEASHGQEALAAFRGNPGIRLAVVDLEMPGMGGRELVRRLREAGGPAIVVLTGSRDRETEAEIIELGADDYLQKPLDPRLFLARVSATLRRARAPSR